MKIQINTSRQNDILMIKTVGHLISAESIPFANIIIDLTNDGDCNLVIIDTNELIEDISFVEMASIMQRLKPAIRKPTAIINSKKNSTKIEFHELIALN